ncbi:platelet endothelial cell adhesion molecule isoform X3 [Micropterus salmoides]|uniref:platelet endothelial cell adhesion molecule isoform X3 n=1 Tax=Micropterus salmoides TaxID=27706 RepID=UPI0018ED1219|nr:platelet endothelial cell adhesion molecule isoform X3 [Micropterus salmoides]
MGLLLLLTFTLLSSYFHPGRVVNAQPTFIIKDITLSIEPSINVTRNTNVTLRCKAIVSSLGQEVLSREYTISKDGVTVYTKTTSTSEDLLYSLREARVFNTGKYACKIKIEDKERTSKAKKLTVTGLSKPVLSLNKHVVNEGEELKARCTAPGETGSIFFFFYDNSEEIQREQNNSNQAEVMIRISGGDHKIQCAYNVLITPDSIKSEMSNTINVRVKELSISPVLEIFPQYTVYEGDQLNILCNISNLSHNSDSARLYLVQGTKLLSSGGTTINHSMVALAKDPGKFECQLVIGSVEKVTTKQVLVTELFSMPTLTMSPAEVFQKENMTLTCKSESYASERLRMEELTYTLDPPNSLLSPRDIGVFSGKALQYDFNYTCVAQAKGITKHSETLTVRPRVSVSTPKISVVGRAILGQPFTILCQSDTGSLPINYTLWKDNEHLSTTSVKQSFEKAIFTVTITKPEEISKFMCKAQNRNKDSPISERLTTKVIVPLTNTTLTVLPSPGEISEGDRLYLICGVSGTPPVTFKWYREGREQPLHTTTSNDNNTDYQVSPLSKGHSGRYYCEAVNYANNAIQSERVTVEVGLAMWKKAMIGGFSLLVLSVVAVVCVLYFKSKRDAAPVYDGMEGRVTNGVRDSSASLPADISNRSSYSIAATV